MVEYFIGFFKGFWKNRILENTTMAYFTIAPNINIDKFVICIQALIFREGQDWWNLKYLNDKKSL